MLGSGCHCTPLFGSVVMCIAMASIGVIGLVVWVHHMYCTVLSVELLLSMGISTELIGVVTLLKSLVWVIGLVRTGKYAYVAYLCFPDSLTLLIPASFL